MIVKKKIWKQLISVIMVCTLITGTADTHTALAGGVLVAAQNDGSDSGTKSISGKVPVLDDHVYSIASANELVWVADKVASGNNFNGYTVKLVSDIDMTDVEWGGIGYNLNNYFSGIFDGCNHTIRNLAASGKVNSFTIINSPRYTIGLFGVCIGAEIKNLVIENTKFSLSNESGYQNAYSSIDGTNIYCGVVVGYAKKCKFQNLTVENSSVVVFTGVEAGNAYAGGIAGYAEQSDFVNCWIFQQYSEPLL